MKGITTLLKYTFVLLLLTCLIVGTSSDGLPVLRASADDANPVLFVHGWTNSHTIWIYVINFFEDDGWPDDFLHAYSFQDSHNCSVAANTNNAHDIKEWVDDILLETGKDKVNLVGFSMGGLSTRYYIKYLGGNLTVDNYVSLVSPQHGTNDASCGPDGNNDFALLLNEGDETPYGILNDTIGFRQDPYFPDRNYTGEHIPGTINYTSVYFDMHDGSFDGTNTSPLDGAHNVLYDGAKGRNHIGILYQERTYELILSAIGGPFDFPGPPTISTTSSDGVIVGLSSLFLGLLVPIIQRRNALNDVICQFSQ